MNKIIGNRFKQYKIKINIIWNKIKHIIMSYNKIDNRCKNYKQIIIN